MMTVSDVLASPWFRWPIERRMHGEFPVGLTCADSPSPIPADHSQSWMALATELSNRAYYELVHS